MGEELIRAGSLKSGLTVPANHYAKVTFYGGYGSIGSFLIYDKGDFIVSEGQSASGLGGYLLFKINR